MRKAKPRKAEDSDLVFFHYVGVFFACAAALTIMGISITGVYNATVELPELRDRVRAVELEQYRQDYQLQKLKEKFNNERKKK